MVALLKLKTKCVILETIILVKTKSMQIFFNSFYNVRPNEFEIYFLSI